MNTIGVFFGSQSPEHDVSIITGEFIISELKKIGYPVVPVYIGKKGEWYIGEALGALKFFTGQTDVQDTLQNGGFSEYRLDLEKSRGKIVLQKKGFLSKETIIDIAFPALHGSYGEDGTIQGLFEMLGVPYVGCGVTSSALTMDKALTKSILQAEKIPTADFASIQKIDWETNRSAVLETIRKSFNGPVFAKPARLGSSIGIGKVKNLNSEDLETKLEVAFHFDTKVVVEAAVEPMMDVTCALLETDQILPSLLQESVFNSDLFGFSEKYLEDGGAQLGNAEKKLHIPARIDAAQTKEMQSLAVRVFKLLGCSGTARVDFLYNTETKKYFINEVNTMPGTLYHHLWKASSVDFSTVLKALLAAAIKRSESRSMITYSFESALLKQANSIKLQTKLG